MIFIQLNEYDASEFSKMEEEKRENVLERDKTVAGGGETS